MSKKNKKSKIVEEMLPKTETPNDEVETTDIITEDTGDFLEIILTKNEAEAFLKARRAFDSTNLSINLPGLRKTVAKMADDQTLTMKIPVNEIRDALLAATEKLGIDADKIINGDTKDLVEAINVPKLMELGLRFVNDNGLTDLFAAVMGKSSDKPEESKETPEADKAESKAEEKPEAKKDDVIQVKGNKTITDPTQIDNFIETAGDRYQWGCNAPAFVSCYVGSGGWPMNVLATVTVAPNGQVVSIHAVSIPVFPGITKDSLTKEELEEIKMAITDDNIHRCCDISTANRIMTSSFNDRAERYAKLGYTIAPIIDKWTWRPKASVKAA